MGPRGGKKKWGFYKQSSDCMKHGHRVQRQKYKDSRVLCSKRWQKLSVLSYSPPSQSSSCLPALSSHLCSYSPVRSQGNKVTLSSPSQTALSSHRTTMTRRSPDPGRSRSTTATMEPGLTGYAASRASSLAAISHGSDLIHLIQSNMDL